MRWLRFLAHFKLSFAVLLVSLVVGWCGKLALIDWLVTPTLKMWATARLPPTPYFSSAVQLRRAWLLAVVGVMWMPVVPFLASDVWRLLLPPQQRFDFLTFEELSRLVEAMKDDPEPLALVLLGAEAGLRQGETMALEWGDVDLVAGLLTVRRSSWRGVIGTPKSGRERKVPLTGRLRAALKAIKHLKSELVLCHADGSPLTQAAIEAALRFGCKKAGLRVIGSHTLRHTFCSHLAMRGAAPKAIQELVGHSTLTMTLRYMHLAPSALTEAIGLLNFGQPVGSAVSVSC